MKAAEEFDRLLRGAGQYTADLRMAGLAEAVFLRSPHAHAGIRGIDATAARALPGVVAVLTAADLPGLGAMPAVAFHPLAPRDALRAAPRPVLAGDRVRHVGEAVALVVAETRAAAEDAAEAVAVEYAPLAAVPVPGAPGPDLHDGIAGNLAMDVKLGSEAEVEARLAASAHVARAVVELPRLVPNPMEPRGAIARWDSDTGLHHLWTPHQGVAEMQGPLARVLGVDPAAIRVHAPDVGGGFGARGPAYPEHAALLAAARLLGRALRWQGGRAEAFLSDTHGRGNRIEGRLGLDAEGRFTALSVRMTADLGAYATTVGAHINLKNVPHCITGCYAIETAALHLRQFYTSAVPTGPYRGAGRPDAACLIERLVDAAARATGRDRVALRAQNAVRPGQMPWATPLGATYDSGDFPALLARAAALADHESFPARRAASASRGRLRGLGLALFVEVAGGGPAPRDEAQLRLTAGDGGLRCEARILGRATGQGHARVFAGLVAAALGCRAEDVTLVVDDGGAGLTGAGSFGSRSSSVIGAALADAAGQARGTLLRLAADLQGRPEAGLDIAGGRLRDGDDDLGPLADLVARATQGRGAIEVTGSAAPSETFPCGCHAAEVELDPATGVLRLLRYAAVDDCGVPLDERLVHAQLHGGIAQGLGEALGEIAVFDDAGQLLSASFMDYAMPRADAMPALGELRVELLCTPSTANPLGVKGVGEAGVAGAISAICNALDDALGPRAGRAQMPFSPARLHAVLSAGT